MPKANRICQYCGKEYYVCYSCVKINSYKRAFCSPECYRASLIQDEVVVEEAKDNKDNKETETKKKTKKKDTTKSFFPSSISEA